MRIDKSTIRFDWDTHVGAQTPEEFAQMSFENLGSTNCSEAASSYLRDVRSGAVFGEPVPLDENAEADLADVLRRAIR